MDKKGYSHSKKENRGEKEGGVTTEKKVVTWGKTIHGLLGLGGERGLEMGQSWLQVLYSSPRRKV